MWRYQVKYIVASTTMVLASDYFHSCSACVLFQYSVLALGNAHVQKLYVFQYKKKCFFYIFITSKSNVLQIYSISIIVIDDLIADSIASDT